MKRIALLAVAGILAFVNAAWAVPMTRTFDFMATEFEPASPADPVTGSFTLTFDPAAGDVYDQAVGITLNSLSIALGSPLSFYYEPDFADFGVGGSEGGTTTLYNTDEDFALGFDWDLTSIPTNADFYYADGSLIRHADQVTVTVRPDAAPAPEPITLLLFGAGLAGIGAVRRRKIADAA